MSPGALATILHLRAKRQVLDAHYLKAKEDYRDAVAARCSDEECSVYESVARQIDDERKSIDRRLMKLSLKYGVTA